MAPLPDCYWVGTSEPPACARPGLGPGTAGFLNVGVEQGSESRAESLQQDFKRDAVCPQELETHPDGNLPAGSDLSLPASSPARTPCTLPSPGSKQATAWPGEEEPWPPPPGRPPASHCSLGPHSPCCCAFLPTSALPRSGTTSVSQHHPARNLPRLPVSEPTTGE